MFDAIKSISLFNIQSHEENHFYFKRTGLHRISAEGTSNSYGKSVLMRVIKVLFKQVRLDKETRLTLIREGAEYGVASVASFNGYRLSVVIHKESSKSFYMLEYQGQVIKKYLTDDYRSLLRVLGAHYFEEGDFSLNLYETKTALPFTHFSGTLNYKILDSASEIYKYRDLIETTSSNLTTIKHDKAMLETRLATVESQIASIDTEGLSTMKSDYEKLNSVYSKYKEVKAIRQPLLEVMDLYAKREEIKLNNYELYEPLMKDLEVLNSISPFINSIFQEYEDKRELEKFNQVNFKVIDSLYGELSTLAGIMQESRELSTNVNTANRLNNVVNTEMVYNLFNSFDTVSNINDNLVSTLTLLQQKNDNIVEPLNINPLLIEQQILEQLSESLLSLDESLKMKSSINLDFIDTQNALTDLNWLQSIESEAENLINNLSTYSEYEDKLCGISEHLELLSNEIGICEKCGQLLGVN